MGVLWDTGLSKQNIPEFVPHLFLYDIHAPHSASRGRQPHKQTLMKFRRILSANSQHSQGMLLNALKHSLVSCVKCSGVGRFHSQQIEAHWANRADTTQQLHHC